MIPATATRVQDATDQEVNQQIEQQTEAWFARYAHADATTIERRLRELDMEWDIERVLQTNFSVINVASITWGALVNRACYLLPGITGFFLLQHALKGWCPPIPIFRRMGFRTTAEIDHERFALKAVRGDFSGLNPQQPDKVLEAARR